MKYDLYSFDVWGNNKDGFEVNDVYFQTSLDFEGSRLPDDKEIIKKLKDLGYIKKNSRFSSFEVDVRDERCIFIDYNVQKCCGYPAFELRLNTED